MHERIAAIIKVLQRYADRWWYSPLVMALAFADNFLLVIPTDGVLVSSVMLTPRRWFVLGVCVSVGSTVGALALGALVQQQGLPWILNFYPGIDQTSSWAWTAEFFTKYGLFLVFAVAVTPFVQQPAVILASLANTSLLQLTLVIFAGRLIKYVIMSYVASHAPRMLSKMWGMKGELKDAGVKVE